MRDQIYEKCPVWDYISPGRRKIQGDMIRADFHEEKSFEKVSIDFDNPNYLFRDQVATIGDEFKNYKIEF